MNMSYNRQSKESLSETEIIRIVSYIIAPRWYFQQICAKGNNFFSPFNPATKLLYLLSTFVAL